MDQRSLFVRGTPLTWVGAELRRGTARGPGGRPVESHAALSTCGRYRYELGRRWATGPGLLVAVMLNPSKADHIEPDNTIGVLMSRAVDEGAPGILVVNLAALRSTDPKGLLEVEDPVGPLNRLYIARTLAAARGRSVLVAWGNLPRGVPQLVEQVEVVRHLAGELGCHLTCLGKTQDGQPWHPLYRKRGLPRLLWP